MIVDEDFAVPATVLLETEWVLRSRYCLPRSTVAAALRMIIDLPHAIDIPPNTGWAIDRLEQGADFADVIHLATVSNASRFATFDQKLAAKAGPATPLPIETLA